MDALVVEYQSRILRLRAAGVGKQSGRMAGLGGGPERLRQRQEHELQSGDECQTWHRRIGHSGDTKC
jgi:hypothetical protein